jgi:hypothetical protein
MNRILLRLLLLMSATGWFGQISAATVTVGSASAFDGPELSDASVANSQHRAYDTTNNLAYAGGAAEVSVVSSNICCYSIHNSTRVNDGFYGNGRSWIGNTANAWLKIDLGSVQSIHTVTFGRDRLGYFDDRDPGQFSILTAVTENAHADGDSSNDGSEYTQIVDSGAEGFSGFISYGQTIAANFDLVSARYVKMVFANPGAGIDEVEIFGVPEPAPLILLGLGLLSLGIRRQRMR